MLMVPKMRRIDRQISEEESRALLHAGEYGILSLAGLDGVPYGVPLSYVFMDEAVYFHSACEGYKIDKLRGDSQACFTVVGPVRPVYVNNFTTCFSSVMVFGRVAEIVDAEPKYTVLYALAAKYLPDYLDKAADDIKRSLGHTAVYGLRPELVTGKAKKIVPGA